MAAKKKFDPGFTPVDLEAMGKESFAAGKCELKRVDCASGSCEEQTLVLVFQPEGWSYSLTVDLGEDVPEFTVATPWEEILKNPVNTKFMWLGKTYKVTVTYCGAGEATVEVREPVSSKGFKKTPFAHFCVTLAGWKEEAVDTTGAVYAVSVASFYEDSGELTCHCDVFKTPEEAADWFEEDWNTQADYYGYTKLTKKAKKKFLKSLTDKGGVAEEESPKSWGPWFKWKGVRRILK